MAGASAYTKVLTARFGSHVDVSADQARAKADELEQRAENAQTRAQADRLYEDAAALKDYAADKENEGSAASSAGKGSGAAAAGGRPRRSSAKRAPAKPKRPRAVRAVGLAVDPTKLVTARARSAAGLGWSITFGTIALAIVYVLVSNASKVSGARSVLDLASVAPRALRMVIDPPGLIGAGGVPAITPTTNQNPVTRRVTVSA